MIRFARLAVLCLSTVVFAQEPEPKLRKVTTIDFEDDTVDGALVRPDGEQVQARQRVKHGNLIRVRTEFKARALQSVGELK